MRKDYFQSSFTEHWEECIFLCSYMMKFKQLIWFGDWVGYDCWSWEMDTWRKRTLGYIAFLETIFDHPMSFIWSQFVRELLSSSSASVLVLGNLLQETYLGGLLMLLLLQLTYTAFSLRAAPGTKPVIHITPLVPQNCYMR